MLTNFDGIPMVISKDTSPQKHIKIYIKICHKNVRMRELKIWKFSVFSVNVFKNFMGMLKNIEKFWWKTEHFWNFQFRKIYRRRRGIENKKNVRSRKFQKSSVFHQNFSIFFIIPIKILKILSENVENFQIFRFAYEYFHLNNGFGLLLVRCSHAETFEVAIVFYRF